MSNIPEGGTAAPAPTISTEPGAPTINPPARPSAAPEPQPAAPVAPPPEPQPAPEPQPPGTTVTDQFGDWRDQLGPDIKGNDAFKNMDGPDALARGYLDRQDGYYRVPGEDASDEQFEEFFESIGVPTTFEEYSTQLQDFEAPENVEVDNDFMKDAVDQAYQLHMYPFQIKEMLNWYYNRMGDRFESIEADFLKQKSQAEETMRQEWGADYRKNEGVMNRALQALGGEKLVDWADEVGISNDPTFMRLIFNIGQNLTEDMVLQGIPVTGGGREPEKQTHLTYPNTPEHGGL